MSKSFVINFLINGSENVSAAVTKAAKQIQRLGNLANAIRQAKTLDNAQNLMRQFDAYKKLQDAIKNAQAARAQELLTASRANAQHSREQKNLQDMRRAYERLNDFWKANRKGMGVDDRIFWQDQMRAAKDQLKAQTKLVENLGRSPAQALERANQLQLKLAQQQAQLSQLRTQLPTANITAAESALRSQIQATTQALNAEIQALERRNRVAQNFSNAQQDLNNAYNNFNNAVDTARTILNPFEEAAQNAITFEQMTSRVKALTQMRNIKEGRLDQVERDMELLTAQAEHLGATTEFTRLEVAAAQSYFGMAGWDTEKILAGVKPVLDLTTIAGDRNLARMADIVSDLMTAMKLKPGQMMKVGDRRKKRC